MLQATDLSALSISIHHHFGHGILEVHDRAFIRRAKTYRKPRPPTRRRGIPTTIWKLTFRIALFFPLIVIEDLDGGIHDTASSEHGRAR